MIKKKEAAKGDKKKAIDWAEAHRRIEIAGNALEHDFQPRKEESERILQARAKTLSAEYRAPKSGESIDVVEFHLASERYAVAAQYVRAVCPLSDLTKIPCTPSFVLGIINVHGQFLSVIDIKKYFNFPPKKIEGAHKVIILCSDEMEFGIVADNVTGVRRVFLSEMQPSFPALAGIQEEYLVGITNDRMVIFNAKSLLSDRKIVVNEQVDI
ncbi:MAG: chemotaxis protein CheW [Candidatus Brocadiaceae bacterium]|nr:chemotaxis protein CheW [Candidatus Brocadiaceae bacterium]